MKRTKLLLAGLLLASVHAWSATITWDTPADISAGQDTLTNQAFAAVNTKGGDTTLNGIEFKSDGNQPNIVVDGGGYGDFMGTDINSTVPVVSQEYYNILKPAHFSVSKVTLNGLLVGQEYFVQLWVNDCRDGTEGRYTVIRSVDGGTTNLITLQTSATQTAGVLGQYVVGRFTADGESQEIDIVPAAGANADNPVINAAAVYFVVPPPQATISWDTAENISGSADFTSNEVYAALNVGGSALTAEGIAFSADDGSLTELTVSGTSESGLIPSASSTIPSVSTEYTTLLNSAKDATTIELSGLQTGDEYFVKVWSTDARTAGIGKTATVEGESVDENVPDSEHGLGQYIVGTFTALASAQTITVSGDINAVEVYIPIPPPPPPTASPADIEWDYARNISSGVDTLTNSVFAALNVAGDANVTLDGVTFTTNASGLIAVAGNSHNDFVPATSGSGLTPPVSGEYITLLDSGQWAATMLTISNLTVGQEYVIQAWSTDARNPGIGRHTVLGDVKLWENVESVENSLGQYVLGRFTAVSNLQFVLVGPAGKESTDHPLINAVVVYEGTTEFAPAPTNTPYDPAPVSWSTPQWITDDADIISTQTLVKAVNAGDGSTATTINGVTFGVDDNSVNGNKHYDFLGDGSLTVPVVSSAYQALLKPGCWGGSLIHLEGLTRGTTYTIQIWVNDSRFDPPNGRAIEMLDMDSNVVSDEIHENDGVTAYSMGQYIVGTFTAAGEVQDITYKGLPGDGDSVVNGYALYEAPPENKFSEWAAGYGLSGSDADEDADPDSDGLNNLYEYGLGGDPTDSADQGTSPTYRKLSAEMRYIYPARTDDSKIKYYLEINNDLVYGTWTNLGYTATSGPSGTPNWDSVTNSIPADIAEKYIRLIIEHL